MMTKIFPVPNGRIGSDIMDGMSSVISSRYVDIDDETLFGSLF